MAAQHSSSAGNGASDEQTLRVRVSDDSTFSAGRDPAGGAHALRTKVSGELDLPAIESRLDGNLGTAADAPATADGGTFSLVALVKRLLQKLTAALDTPLTALRDGIVTAVTASASALETVSAASFQTVQTAATGANWTALAGGGCKQATIYNYTDTELELRRGGAGATFPLPAFTGTTVRGLANAGDVQVRRKDQDNTPLTVNYELEG
ncbi:MAG: hypothetical protein LBK60_01520 [Verrucomicrobiales bacterium]|jgi:hypothetical protein|nr:hypothetical protein [Verrucomicrobiales bacterium]